MKNLKQPLYAILAVGLLTSCAQDEIETAAETPTSTESSVTSGKTISEEAQKKFIADNGLKLIATIKPVNVASKATTTGSTTIQEEITPLNLQQLGLTAPKIVNIYKGQFGNGINGVIVNNYKTNNTLVRPANNNAKAYVKTALPVIESFLPELDETQMLFSGTTIYNSSSSPITYSKQVSYNNQMTLANAITLNASLNVGGKVTVTITSPSNITLPGGTSIPLPVVQGSVEASFETTLSATNATTITKNKSTTLTETVNTTIPSNKKLFVYVAQKVQKGTVTYRIPISYPGNVITKNANAYVNRPASFLQQNKTIQRATVKYGYNAETQIYIKELGLNETAPTVPN
ncbi:hypothetical protein ABEG63_06240 [Chryseobacterium sp. C39-AII1]|uniref:hypothetical protein n=1 Tax=Chryseobacterium sp. C39-AII1 TaxID=3080332 RepID=UPI0032082148